MMLADNAEISYQSGVSRLFGKWCAALCLAPALILGACLLLGWNEHRAVCEDKENRQGEQEVVLTDCNNAVGDGKLIMSSCPLQRTGLPYLSVAGDFTPYLMFQGVGLATEAEIYQCVEKKSTVRKKDPVGGGTTTVTTYTYERQWVSSPVDSSGFQKKDSDNFRQNCGAENPQWYEKAPTAGVSVAESAMVGPYRVPKSPFLEKVPLDFALTARQTPYGWRTQADGWYLFQRNYPNNLGDTRVRFFGNDWNQNVTTVLGLNTGGSLGVWKASDSWLCSGFQLAECRRGKVSKDELFQAMDAGSSTVTWVLRIIAFAVLWMGFWSLFGPMEVFADCIPCIGPYLGDAISCITGCLTCPIACSCGLGVAGVCWVVMRPLVGSGLLLLFCLGMGVAVALKAHAKNRYPSDAATGFMDNYAAQGYPGGGQAMRGFAGNASNYAAQS